MTDDLFVPWYRGLSDEEAQAVDAALGKLEEKGPNLSRPFVDQVKGSRHHNLKELRAPSNNTRVLFAFDPWRQAVLLIGGSKTNDWKGWYKANVPIAEVRLDAYLKEEKRRRHE